MANRKITYEVGFIGNTSQLQAALKQAVASLQEIGTKPEYLRKGLQDASRAALELNNHLRNAYNQDTGKLDLTRFRQELEKSGQRLQDYATRLTALGPVGEKAFMNVAQAIGAAELPLKRSNALFDKLWVTMKNTARWRLTTGALNAFIGGLQSAFGYAKNLDESLNNIRIVTGKSADEMARFASEANKAAQRLSTTTTSYTDASLIYYQQGLSDKEVQDRTDTTIKMANVTGQSAEAISSQMTAVWNNFKEGSRTLESYADTMVALGATTASSSKEIAEGLEKFAPIANSVGLSFDYASASLATLVATTRESASVAGNALKTLFSRLEGLKLGETLDDGTDLNKYSQALYTVGINIKDTNGQLKDMDTILEELGSRWQTLARDEQMALAETVGGVRQYAQLVALMDNWSTFQENLVTARGAEGSLEKQAEIYAESWEAARARVKAATQDVYDSLINPSVFTDLNNVAQPILKTFASILDAVGGLTGLLPILSALMFKVYGSQIANSLRDMAINIGLMTSKEQERVRAIQAQSAALVERLSLSNQDQSTESTRIDILKTQIGLQGEINARADQYSEQQLSHIKNESYIIELLRQQALKQADLVDKSRQAFIEQSDTIYSILAKPNFGSSEDATQEFARWFVNGFSKNALPLFTDALYELVSFNGSMDKAFSELESGLEKIAQKTVYIEKLRSALGEVNQSSQIWKSNIQELAINAGLWTEKTEITDEALNQLRATVARTGNAAQEADKDMQHFQEILIKLGKVEPSSVIRYIAAMKELQRTAIDNQWSTEQFKEAVAKLIKEMQLGIHGAQDWANTFVMVGRAMSQAAMGMRSIESLGRALTDTTLDSGQRVTQLLTSAAMIMPILVNGISAVGKAIKGTAIGVQTTIPILAAASVIIYGIIKVIQAIVITQEEAQKAIGEAITTYKEASSELESLQNELKTTQDRIKELQEQADKGTLSIVDKEELENLKTQNIELERQVELQKRIQQIKQKEAVNEIISNGLTAYQFTAKPGTIGSETGWTKEEIQSKVDALNSDLNTMQSFFPEQIKHLQETIGDTSLWENAPAKEEMQEWIDQLEWDPEQYIGIVQEDFNSFKSWVQDEYIPSIYNWMPEGTTEAEIDKWLAENIDTYEKLETAYETMAQAIIDGQLDANNLYFKLLKERLQETRELIHEEDYVKTFIDPVINQLSITDLSSIISNNINNLSQEGKNLLTLFGVEPEEIAKQYAAAFSKAKDQLSKFGLEDIELTYVQAKLIADKDFDNFSQLLDYLKETGGIVPVSLQVSAAEDARAEALTAFASGDFLDEEIVQKLQETYQNLVDLTDFNEWSVEQQIQFLKSEGKLAQQEIENQQKAVKELWAQKAQIKEYINSGLASPEEFLELSSWESAINKAIDEVESEIKKLQEQIEKEPWKIQLEIDEKQALAAEFNNAKKALALINDDLSISADNVLELSKRYPQALVDATYDADQNILHIEQEKYDQIKSYINDNLDKQRDAAVEELQIAIQLAGSALGIVKETEDEKRQQYKNSLISAIGTDDKKLQSAKSTALDALKAIIQNQIEIRQAELDTMKQQITSSKVATDTVSENAKVMTENLSNAAWNIMQSFDMAFRAISIGMQQITNPQGTYRSIMQSGVQRSLDTTKGSTGVSYAATEAELKNDPQYQALEKEIKRLNTFMTALNMYGTGDISKETLQSFFDYLPDTVQESLAGIKDALVNINLDTSEGIADFYEQIGQDTSGLIDDFIKELQSKYNISAETLQYLLDDDKDTSKTGSAKKNKQDLAKLNQADLNAELQALEEIEDRYHEITREIERQGRVLSKLETQMERTYGLDRLKLYEQQIKELTKLQNDQRAKSARAERYLKDTDRPRLEAAFKSTQYNSELNAALARAKVSGFAGAKSFSLNINPNTQEIREFEQLEKDINEDVNNFMTVYQAFMIEYDKFVQAYEVMTDEEKLLVQAEAEQWKLDYELLKEQFKLVEAQQKERLEAIEQYESTLDTINTLAHEIEDSARRIEDAKLNNISYRMEVILDVRDARKQIRDFTKEIAESFGDALTHGVQVASLNYEQAKDEMAMYKEYVQEYNDLKALFDNANEFTDTTAIIDELKNLEGNIIESGQRLLEWFDTVENMFVDALNAAADRFSYFTSQLEHNSTMLDTIKELYALQGQTYKTQKGFERLQKVSQEKLETQIGQAQLQRKWFEEADAKLQEAQGLLDALIAEKGAEAEQDIRYDTYKKNRDALLEEQRQAQEKMLSYAKDAMETARQMYLDEIEKMSYDLEQKLTNGVGFDLLQDKYDHFIEEQDRYLDPIEEGMETAKWYAKLQADIDNTSNNLHKQKLQSLQKEIDLRRENNTLSQYDLDLLEAKYKVLQASMALEDARDAKNQVRLVRDSNGNWNYQFTSNPEDIKAKEQEMLKSLQDEYEITKTRYSDLNSELLKMAQEFAEKDRQIREDMANGILTEEEGQARLKELEGYYTQKAAYLQKELSIAETDLDSAAVRSAVLAANFSESVYQTSDATIQAIVDNFKNNHDPALLAQATTSLSSLQDTLALHIGDFEDASDQIKGNILSIITADNQDGEGIGFEGLIAAIKEKDPEIADKLQGWVETFGSKLNDDDGIAGEFGTLRDIGIEYFGDEGLKGIVSNLTGEFTSDLASITSSVKNNFIPIINDYVPKADQAFENYGNTVTEVADKCDVSLDQLDNAVERVSGSTDIMITEGYNAADALWTQLSATWDAQQGYLELAQAVWEYIYALQALAANQVVPTIEAASGVDTSSKPYEYDSATDWSIKMGEAAKAGDWELVDLFGEYRERKFDEGGFDRSQAVSTENLKDNLIEAYKEGNEDLKEALETVLTGDKYYRDVIPIASAATGMYTGDFNNGRLAILHEKELVLNQEDTENILDAVQMVRTMQDNLFSSISESLNNNGFAAMALLGSRIGGINLPGAADSTLEQHVTIENVSFPGVTSSREIEEAFENLVNDAAQWAKRRKS